MLDDNNLAALISSSFKSSKIYNKVYLWFDTLNGCTKIISPASSSMIMMGDKVELLQFYYDFDYVPFVKLQLMVKNRVIPSKLKNCATLTYSVYIAGIIEKRN